MRSEVQQIKAEMYKLSCENEEAFFEICDFVSEIRGLMAVNANAEG